MSTKRSIQRNMFYGAKHSIFLKAKELRDNMTDSEKVLWNKLRNKQILNLRFKPQHPIDRFIVDFYCHKTKLVIEVDGGIHNSIENKQYDIGRTAELERFGISVIRFSNEETNNDIESVVKKILEKCKELLEDNIEMPERNPCIP